MNILIAPNTFKNSLPADLAAKAIQEGLLQSKLSCHCISFPIGDGGDGTAELLIQRLNGKKINAAVHDPLGRNTTTYFGLLENKTAIIELANASGLRLLRKDEYNPLHATTYGTGELIKASLNENVKKIILCIGGSATVDGGAGVLRALGVRFLDQEGSELNQLPLLLTSLNNIDITDLDKRLKNTELILVCDVQNKLLGENGAAKIFGPQKGASGNDVQLLEACLTRFREIAFTKTGKDMGQLKYGGAAGGVPAALHAFLNAKLVNGIEFFLDNTNFDLALAKADLIITGEGSIDLQTLEGKGPYGVALRAKKESVPVIAFAGNVSSKDHAQLKEYFDEIISINPPDIPDLKIALENTYDNLVKAGKSFGEQLKMKRENKS